MSVRNLTVNSLGTLLSIQVTKSAQLSDVRQSIQAHVDATQLPGNGQFSFNINGMYIEEGLEILFLAWHLIDQHVHIDLGAKKSVKRQCKAVVTGMAAAPAQPPALPPVNNNYYASSGDADSNKSKKKTWQEYFQMLQEYKLIHHDTNVPFQSKEFRSLGIWVATQRTQYRRLSNGVHSNITQERIDQLNSIDFCWEPKSLLGYKSWEESFENLKKYKSVTGHTNVPTRYQQDVQLGTWVKKQRAMYRLFREGKKSQINQERIDLMDSIGFQWVCGVADRKRKIDADKSVSEE